MRNPLKNILLVLFLLALVTASIYEYFRLKKTRIPVSTAITAIPINASFILECRKVYPLWKSVSQTSLIWQDILGIDAVNTLNHKLLYLDSLLDGNTDVHGILEGTPLFISAHKNGMQGFDYLFICSVQGEGMQNALLSFIASRKSPAIFNYDGATLYTITLKNHEKFAYTISHNGVFICSFRPELVKESIRQLRSGISLMNNRYFTKVLATSGNKVIANLFVNFKYADNILSPLLDKASNSSLTSLANFAQWIELDLNFTPNEIMMDGFADCDTTGGQFLDLLAGQLSHKINISSVVPSNTALMSVIELRDYTLFSKQYKKYMELHNRLYRYNEWTDKMKETYNFNAQNYFSWVNNEMAFVITEPTDSSLTHNVFAVLGTDDDANAITVLDSLADSVAHIHKKEPLDIKFMQHDIHYIALNNLIPDMLGGMFGMIKKTYYTALGGYVVFANSPEALQVFINQYEEGNTLDKDTYYQSFIKDHVENEAGMYVYNNIALSPVLYRHYLDKEYAEADKKYTPIWKNFQAVSVQMSYMQNMFYTDVYFKRNPKFKKQAGALWQTELDTSLAGPPCWVTDYRTEDKFVFAQDKKRHVYLISNTGKILWNDSTDGKIMSKIYEVDALKNNKLQYLFNTEKSIYAIDRDGNNVSGFPVRLSSAASAPLSLFDYDGDKNYRILVPCADKIIREYNIGGRQVNGWLKPETNDTVTCCVKHIIIGEKDYLVAIDNKGKVYLYDRKGAVRLQLHHSMPAHISAFYMKPGDKSADTYIIAADSYSEVTTLGFAGTFSRKRFLADSEKGVEFIPADLNGNGKTDMLFLSSGEIFVYDSTGSLLFKCSGRDSLSTMRVLVYPGGNVRIGAVDNKKNKIYLWDNTGGLCNSFPLYGNTGYAIADMNDDGQLYLAAGSKDNNIYVYSLP